MSHNAPKDGCIKFRCSHTCAEWNSQELPLDKELLSLLKETDRFRTRIFDQSFIGMYESGIGYGNLSFHCKDKFIITASGTGGARELGIDGYTLVCGADIKNNTVYSIGPLPASSETMSHAAVYAASPSARFVLHIHNMPLFSLLKEKNALSTAEDIAYGTPEMAQAITAIVQKYPSEGIIAMLGHEEGILLYGMSIAHIEAQLAFICQEARKKQCTACKKGEHYD